MQVNDPQVQINLIEKAEESKKLNFHLVSSSKEESKDLSNSKKHCPAVVQPFPNRLSAKNPRVNNLRDFCRNC